MQIPIYKPQLPPYESVEPDIRAMYTSGLLSSTAYTAKYTGQLEKRIADICGVPFVQTISSCSLGLILVFNILPKQSKVIMPSFTFNATLQALEWNDHVPVIVDVDDDGQMRPDLAEAALNDHPDAAAIFPVHMWGNACYPEEFEILAKEKGVHLFFDGAHVFGTTFKGRSLSQFGDGVVYSIAVTKPLSAGEGGLLATTQEWVYEGVKEGVAHGLWGSLDTRTRGINGKIQEFNAILALHALDMFDETKRRRAQIINTYRTSMSDLPIRIWKTRENVDPSYKDCVLFVSCRAERDRLEMFMNQKGIGTKRYFDPAVADMGSFKGIVHSTDNGRKLADTCLTIPLYPALTDLEVQFIISTIRSFYGAH